jgi:hypothetical protein
VSVAIRRTDKRDPSWLAWYGEPVDDAGEDYWGATYRAHAHPLGGGKVVFLAFVCDRGHHTMLSRTVHRVSKDGTVSPSYVCTKPGCSFHTFVRLVGWQGLIVR